MPPKTKGRPALAGIFGRPREFLPSLLIFSFLWLAACAPTSRRVVLIVDGNRRVFETMATTVQEVLYQQNIAVGESDKVDPPLFAEVGRSTTITVTRVVTRTETVTLPIPFARQLVRDETYPQGQVRVVQLGKNGSVAITYTIALADGAETSRRESARRVEASPQDEILALGTLNSLPPVSLSNGTIAYLANGNAWVMRRSSRDKRALTATADLDGRVFSLTPDGRYLLFTRAAGEGTLNTLWLVDTVTLGETARSLPINDVLFAELSPDARTLAYSTGERTVGAPGWKAHNDLWLMPIAPGEGGWVTRSPQQLWKASYPAAYSWWGTNFTWSPDGRAIAFAFANEIGWVEMNVRPSTEESTPRHTLKRFAPFRTQADWVWVPQVRWSSDSRFVVGTVHAPLGNPGVASDDPTFEVWALARDGSVNAPLAKQTGMWALPTWSLPDARGESRIVFGSAVVPSNSERSRYSIWVMDRDGANKKQIFPRGNEDALTVVQIAWSPDARQLLAVRDNDLWLYDFASAQWAQLTANGASAMPRWGK